MKRFATEMTRPTEAARLGHRRIGWSSLALLACLAVAGGSFVTTATPDGALAADTSQATLSPPLGFELAGSGGYTVEVAGSATQEGSSAEAVVKVSNRRGAVTYRFPAVVEEGSIQADLGSYGQISVAFHATSGGSGGSELGCSRGLSSVSGYYEGAISFHAKGLTHVAASRAEGSNGLALELLCAQEPGVGRLPGPGTYLEVTGRSSGPTLTILQGRGGGATQIEATLAEDHGVEIERSVTTVASNIAFRHDRLRSAEIRPPFPFEGSATLTRRAGKIAWRGNLRVDFPGRANVALTGPGLRARLGRRLGP